MTVLAWFGVVLVGGAGAVLRFVVDSAVAGRFGGRLFPIGTFAVNLSGSLLLGLLTGLALGHDASLVAGTAAIGSYTTFSTWMLETHRAAEERLLVVVGLNVLASLAFGLGAAALGRWIGAGL